MSTSVAIGPKGGWNGASAGEQAYAPPFSMFLLAGALNWNILSGLVLQNAMRGVGFSVAQIAGITAVRSIPTTTFLLWGPLVDGASTRRRWYSAGAVLMGASLLACYAIPWTPNTLGLLAAFAFTAAIGRVLGLTAVKGIIATGVRSDALSTASGWYVTGQGVLVGAVAAGSLWLVAHISSHAVAAGISILICAGCVSAIFFVPSDLPKPWHGVLRGVYSACIDAWQLMRSRRGLLAAVVFLVPVGNSYAMTFLAGAIANDWGVSSDLLATLAIVATILNGAAALAAARLCRALGPWRVYIGSSVCVAIMTLTLSILPRTPLVFAMSELGLEALHFASWTAGLAIMMTICGGASSATKAALLTSLFNLADSPLTIALGVIHERVGPSTMVAADGAFQTAGLVLIYLAAWLLGLRPKELERRAVPVSNAAVGEALA